MIGTGGNATHIVAGGRPRQEALHRRWTGVNKAWLPSRTASEEQDSDSWLVSEERSSTMSVLYLVVPIFFGADGRRVPTQRHGIKIHKHDVAARRALRHPLFHDDVPRPVSVQQCRPLHATAGEFSISNIKRTRFALQPALWELFAAVAGDEMPRLEAEKSNNHTCLPVCAVTWLVGMLSMTMFSTFFASASMKSR